MEKPKRQRHETVKTVQNPKISVPFFEPKDTAQLVVQFLDGLSWRNFMQASHFLLRRGRDISSKEKERKRLSFFLETFEGLEYSELVRMVTLLINGKARILRVGTFPPLYLEVFESRNLVECFDLMNFGNTYARCEELNYNPDQAVICSDAQEFWDKRYPRFDLDTRLNHLQVNGKHPLITKCDDCGCLQVYHVYGSRIFCTYCICNKHPKLAFKWVLQNAEKYGGWEDRRVFTYPADCEVDFKQLRDLAGEDIDEIFECFGVDVSAAGDARDLEKLFHDHKAVVLCKQLFDGGETMVWSEYVVFVEGSFSV